MPRSPERDYGLNQRHQRKLARTVQKCKYIDPVDGLCGMPVTVEDAPLHLCQGHWARALEFLLPVIKQKLLHDPAAQTMCLN